MDKLFKNSWFVKVISLFIALMLYMIVNMSGGISSSSTGVLPTATDWSYTLQDVELKAQYNSDKYVVTGLPKTVDVKLEGSNNYILMERFASNHDVYVDLTHLGSGQHVVPIHQGGFAEELDVTINPSSISIMIEEKVTKKVPIEIELLNEDQLAKDYDIQDVVITPKVLHATGTSEQLDQVESARGFIDVKEADGVIEESVPIHLYSEKGEELSDLNIKPTVVDVKVMITGLSKTVPLKINLDHALPAGLSIKSLQVNPSEVTIFGPSNIIETTDYLNRRLNLSDITTTGKKSIQMTVEPPENVKRIDPQTIDVTVEVDDTEQKSLQKIPVKVTGLSNLYDYTFLEPANGVVDATVSGAPDIIEGLEAEDVEAYVDASGRGQGTHELPVHFNGPLYVTWEDKKITVDINK